MISGRTVIREFLSALRRKGKHQRNIIILGSGKRARKFVEILHRIKKLGYQVIGFVDDEWDGSQLSENLCHRLGNLSDIPNILNNNIVDEVALSLPIKSYYEIIEEIISYCEQQGIIVRLLTDVFTVTFSKSKLTKLDELQVLTLYSAPYEDPRIIVKRAFDILVSLIMILLLSPLLIIVGICIKIFSKGPMLFVQKRVGYNKRIFKLFKFRTMIDNAEEMLPSLEHLNEADGASFKIKDDPRITKFGKFLRKTSIDELPQLINVLKGDMSLVGPRPLQLRDYMALGANWHKRRFSMVPGMTCFWQVDGRNNLNFARWMELDMEYIDQWSLWLDLKILWKTIPTIITGKGAM
jgi:exopolysaccharide biosynthesis polyprenyl glycosylphosphotransferase